MSVQGKYARAFCYDLKPHEVSIRDTLAWYRQRQGAAGAGTLSRRQAVGGAAGPPHR